ncbi:hypothetical protein [Actinacidiphila sp. ITFR-21]|uniref:hypothetical protein n=1 Tax=Actinacidiphila sp. ITFR-21 TaxID=3075199 RepID=UPI00288BC9E9|nr:hypothetical protein [Streptomyces sp. ITFR-21]WNI17659.1 hypothetical protein RLT57_20430 [Streptomyces sp. ITFR-21]WNI17799.1 hypothetical protein RLT57_21145 [Streptomyces sp. ITFR-21]
MTFPVLFVPAVEDDDQGLVLEVNGVAPEPQSRRWWLLTTRGDAFCLPAKLWPWAMEVDAQTKRRELRMPAVFAFRLVGETMAADIISRS